MNNDGLGEEGDDDEDEATDFEDEENDEEDGVDMTGVVEEDYFGKNDEFVFEDGMDKLLSGIDESAIALPSNVSTSSGYDSSPPKTLNEEWICGLTQKLKSGVCLIYIG